MFLVNLIDRTDEEGGSTRALEQVMFDDGKKVGLEGLFGGKRGPSGH